MRTFLNGQRLAPTIAAAIEDLTLQDELSSGLWEELRTQRRVQFMQALANLRAATDLHVWLTAAGFEHLFLKGPLLAHRIHGGFERRSVSDIDLLVARGAVDRVERELFARDYKVRYGTLLGRGISRVFTHHFAYASERQTLEVHWCLVRESGVRVDMDAVWAHRGAVDFRGASLPVPSLETSLLIQVLGVAKDLELGSLTLRSFVDVYALARVLGTTFDWRSFLELLSQQGAGRLAVVVLELTLRLMECRAELSPLTAAVEERLDSMPRLQWDHPTMGLEVFGLQPPALRNKRILFPLHRGGASAAWAWWTLSYPFRKAVYQES
ncbi:MAG: nucleotidyltransferase family protein [Acidobacteriota bacterium]|nr:nucleotidyltransferase family protein [Acidobacteriota bacterium]